MIYHIELDTYKIPRKFTLYGIIVSFTIGFVLGATAFCLIHDLIMRSL